MKLSIITINYNNSDGLKATVSSVSNQNSRNGFEYIVIDVHPKMDPRTSLMQPKAQ